MAVLHPLTIDGCRAAAIGLGLLALSTAECGAQSVSPWGGPSVIAAAKTVWTRPTIAADAGGRIHVLWADRRVAGAPGKDEKGDRLFHAQWDGQEWRAAVEVLKKDRDAFCLVYPDAMVGSDDQLYVVWSGQGALYFSRASAATAHDPGSWLAPRRIVQAAMIDQSRIIRDPGGRLHVVYTRLASDDGPAGNAFYVWSSDGGATWSTPRMLSRVPVADPRVASVPRLVLDGAGSLHVAWEEPAPPSWLGDRILYVRSEDGGRSWSEPAALATVATDGGGSGSGDRNSAPSLVATGRSSLHAMWACGVPPTRCYRTSADGGREWSSTRRVFPDFVSMAGWDGLVADAHANLHLVAQLRMPYGVYWASKPAGGEWRQPVRFVGEQGFEDAHFVSAVAVGTEVHAVWQKGPASGDVVYAHLRPAGADADATPSPSSNAPP